MKLTLEEIIEFEKEQAASNRYNEQVLKNGGADRSMVTLFKENAEYYEQLAGWLAELKIYKECNTSKANFNMGYNKAIDEFEERLTDELFLEGQILDKVSEIAEELKGGKVDG